jgi:tetratricopeptide (TPR) repeat protein
MRSTICRIILIALMAASSPGAVEPDPCQAGLDQFKAGDYATAQRTLSNCVESRHGSANHAFRLALTYRSLKNYEAGLSRTNAALKQSPEDVDLLYLAAYLHYRRNETKDSMVLLSKAYKLAPNDWRLHQLFALNYISFEMHEEAKLSLVKAIALNPNYAELHYQLGRLYFTLNRFEDSIQAMKSALAIMPDYPEVYDSLGLTYEALQDAKRAAENYTKAIEIDRKRGIRDEWPLINYGTFLLHEESPLASLPFLSKALEFNPQSTKANYQMGRALCALKRNAGAEKYFEKTIQLEPSFSSAYYQLATLIRNRGDRERATVLMAQFKALVDKEEKTGASGTPSR